MQSLPPNSATPLELHGQVVSERAFLRALTPMLKDYFGSLNPQGRAEAAAPEGPAAGNCVALPRTPPERRTPASREGASCTTDDLSAVTTR